MLVVVELGKPFPRVVYPLTQPQIMHHLQLLSLKKTEALHIEDQAGVSYEEKVPVSASALLSERVGEREASVFGG